MLFRLDTFSCQYKYVELFKETKSGVLVSILAVLVVLAGISGFWWWSWERRRLLLHYNVSYTSLKRKRWWPHKGGSDQDLPTSWRQGQRRALWHGNLLPSPMWIWFLNNRTPMQWCGAKRTEIQFKSKWSESRDSGVFFSNGQCAICCMSNILKFIDFYLLMM